MQLTSRAPKTKIAKLANTVYPDEAAHNELPHLDLHCLPSGLLILNIDINWMNQYLNFANVNFV